MANLSKVKIGEVVYDLKDATSRANLTTILGGHAVEALGAAAWLGVDTAVTENGTGVVTGGKIKEYVDAQVGSIHKFDVKVLSAGEDLPTASESTMYIIYLKPDTSAEAGSYVEYITVRSGAEGAYTYAWEAIGSTKTDLSDYVKKTTKIAGVDLQDDITAAELQTALGLEDLAYADTASGKFTPAGTVNVSSDAIKGVTVTVGDATYTSTPASLTYGDYTPSGAIALDDTKIEAADKIVVTGVTIGEGSTAETAATVTASAYTPAGSVTIAKDNAKGVEISGTVSKPTITVTAGSETFVKSLKDGTVDAATFTEGEFTPAEIQDGFYTAGSDASFTEGKFTPASLGDASTNNFNTDGMKAHMAEGDEIAGDVDAETLVFVAASTSAAVTGYANFSGGSKAADTFTGGKATVIDTTKFSGGSKDADNFSANKLPVVGATAAPTVTAALDEAPVFTGDKFSATFTGTEEANMKVTAVKYDKVTPGAATVTKSAIKFTGTEMKNFTVTGVAYDKANKATVSVDTALATTTATFAGTEDTVTVSPGTGA